MNPIADDVTLSFRITGFKTSLVTKKLGCEIGFSRPDRHYIARGGACSARVGLVLPV